MFLYIMFKDENTPFILEQKSQLECFQTIERAERMGIKFDKCNFVIEPDCIKLYAWKNYLNKSSKEGGHMHDCKNSTYV